MMYIVSDITDSYGNQTTVEETWYVGNKITPSLKRAIRDVLEVQADGDELMHILKNFSGIPQHNTRRVVRWFGDDARFIVGNI